MIQNKNFTVMLLSETSGKHYAAKMNLYWLFLIIIFIVCVVTSAAISSMSYFKTRRENVNLQESIARQAALLSTLKQETSEAELYKTWADNIIYRRLNFEDNGGRGTNVTPESVLDGTVDGAVAKSNLLDVDEFDVRRVNLELDFEVSFNLINRAPNNKKLSGYIYLLASNLEVVPVSYLIWPRVEIVSGMPKDFKKGVNFSIRYLKNIKGRINQPEIGPKFNRIDLIAYSEDGNIIMKKGFYIERMLKLNPYE